jgi:hypothetical protein
MSAASKLVLLLVPILAVFMLSCQSGTPQAENQGPGAAKGRGRGKSAAAPAERRVTVPEGTELPIRLSDTLDTGKTTEGATFQGTLAEALVVHGVEVASAGSAVSGRVTNVVSSGRLKRPAEISLVLTSLTAGGATRDITTTTWSSKAESHKKRNLEMIGGGGGAGAIIGAIAGGKKGALIGGAVGAGAGTGVATATGKKEIVLPAETKLDFKLGAPVTLTVK